MKKIFAVLVVFALVTGAAFAATKEVSGPATITGAEYSHVVIRFPGNAGTQEEDLGAGDSFELPAGYTMTGTVREYKKLEIKRAATPAPVEIKRGMEPVPTAELTGTSQKTGKSYSSSWEALMASRQGKEAAASAAAPAVTVATPAGLTIGQAPAQPATAAIATPSYNSAVVMPAAKAPAGLKAEIRKYGFAVVDPDPADERLGWAANFAASVGAKVYATSEGCLVVWYQNSGLISGSKTFRLEKDAPVSIDYDAGGRGGHANPGEQFRWTGRITVRY